jgi:hypothetical protein
MFEMRQQSLMSDSFKLSLSWVFQSVGLAPIRILFTYALYRPQTPAILQKRLGLDADEALCEERDTNSIGGIVLAVEMRSDAGEEYDSEVSLYLPRSPQLPRLKFQRVTMTVMTVMIHRREEAEF